MTTEYLTVRELYHVQHEHYGKYWTYYPEDLDGETLMICSVEYVGRGFRCLVHPVTRGTWVDLDGDEIIWVQSVDRVDPAYGYGVVGKWRVEKRKLELLLKFSPHTNIRIQLFLGKDGYAVKTFATLHHENEPLIRTRTIGSVDFKIDYWVNYFTQIGERKKRLGEDEFLCMKK